jgi:hypothetical protein
MKQLQNKGTSINLDNNEVVQHTSMLMEMLWHEHEFSKHLIRNYEAELMSLPEGSLCKKMINERAYLYHSLANIESSTGFSQKYITNSDDGLAEGLMRKAILKRSLPWLKKNDLAIRKFFKSYRTFDPTKVEESLPAAYRGIKQKINTKQWIETGSVDSYSKKELNDIKEWSEAEFNSNLAYPEALIHTTVGGRKVRSKSEAIIAGLLETSGIPFRYEAELLLGDLKYYPDFTLRRPKDGKIFYWEHFGLTVNLEYQIAMEQKLHSYWRHGITPWDRLLTTYDLENGSIDVQTIQSVIKAFLH